MSRYTADSRDRVRDAVDMLALVESKVELRRAGQNSYFGRCPFHDERTASFHVRPDDKHYYCFGCSESGDPYDFVMQTEGLDFKGALESLAGRFGVELQTEDEDPAAAARRARRARLHALLGRAAKYYARTLWESGEAAAAREYLHERGLEPATLHEFRVGYAPSGWEKLVHASRTAGFTDDELLAAGLAQRSRRDARQLIDRFRGRIMFPSADARGRVVGFGARAMSADQQPKYLNSSDGEIYHKREQLFGIDLARATAARSGRMILVEGYTDVLALHQAGVRGAVGIMGTSLTEEQLGELARVVRILELCLDADAAGQQAMLRAAELAAGRGLELRVVPLPAGRDPADLIAAEGADALKALVERSQPFVVFRVARILDTADTRSAEGRDAALRELRPVVADVPASVLRDDLLRRIAGRLELSESQLAMLLSGAAPAAGAAPALARAGNGASAGAPPAGGRPLDTQERAERAFLALCVAMPAHGRDALGQIDPERHLTSALMRRAAGHLIAVGPEAPLTGLPADDDDLARAMADLVARAGRAREIGPDNLEHTRLMLELARIERGLRRARAERSGEVGALAREREAIRARIGEVVGRLEEPA